MNGRDHLSVELSWEDIVWNDPDLAVAWPIERLQGIEVSLSGKDAEAAGFKAAEVAGDVFP